ncbi:MAG: group II intron reverse transcriptase/maturase [Bdellovibrio sp.]
MNLSKPYNIPKSLVATAFKVVKNNAGSAGIDKQSICDFEINLKRNLYKIWNRMSSGTYFPPAVKAVHIPKKNGGTRVLGVPTVADRVAQMVVKLQFEPKVESIFLPDSYGYRPGKSALDAIAVTRERCWRNDWVLEFDIKGLFDNIDHNLMMRAVRKHTQDAWVIMYIERWLRAPLQTPEGVQIQRSKGTPQGGVISPVLSNLFLHYVFDVWMGEIFPENKWCRYADDGLVHCKTKSIAEKILAKLKSRFEEWGLELHETKTKIVYCKDGKRKGTHKDFKFDFLGYTFRPRLAKGGFQNCLFVSFLPAVSESALKGMCKKIRRSGFRNRTDLSLRDIAKWFNPILQGWLNYYGKYYPSAMYRMLRSFNRSLIAWAMKKYKRLRGRKTRAAKFLEKILKAQPTMFAHWKMGMINMFA